MATPTRTTGQITVAADKPAKPPRVRKPKRFIVATTGPEQHQVFDSSATNGTGWKLVVLVPEARVARIVAASLERQHDREIAKANGGAST